MDTQDGGPRMPLGEHLEELRRRIIYALIGLALATAACLVFGPQIVNFFRHPYQRAMEEVGREPDLTFIIDMDPQTALLMGVCCSGYYVMTGRTPELHDLMDFMENWRDDPFGMMN